MEAGGDEKAVSLLAGRGLKAGDTPPPPPGAENSPGDSLLTNYFQSRFKSFTCFDTPTARVFFICSHPYRPSPQISKCNLSSLRDVFGL